MKFLLLNCLHIVFFLIGICNCNNSNNIHADSHRLSTLPSDFRPSQLISETRVEANIFRGSDSININSGSGANTNVKDYHQAIEKKTHESGVNVNTRSVTVPNVQKSQDEKIESSLVQGRIFGGGGGWSSGGSSWIGGGGGGGQQCQHLNTYNPGCCNLGYSNCCGGGGGIGGVGGGGVVFPKPHIGNGWGGGGNRPFKGQHHQQEYFRPRPVKPILLPQPVPVIHQHHPIPIQQPHLHHQHLTIVLRSALLHRIFTLNKGRYFIRQFAILPFERAYRNYVFEAINRNLTVHGTQQFPYIGGGAGGYEKPGSCYYRSPFSFLSKLNIFNKDKGHDQGYQNIKGGGNGWGWNAYPPSNSGGYYFHRRSDRVRRQLDLTPEKGQYGNKDYFNDGDGGLRDDGYFPQNFESFRNSYQQGGKSIHEKKYEASYPSPSYGGGPVPYNVGIGSLTGRIFGGLGWNSGITSGWTAVSSDAPCYSDYECPGHQKCCGRICKTPSFSG